ncbi:MAG: FHA domain-containing protein [Anaerolineaceae bacterium]|nr:FHA domain-containing protein [Anaerolineaceae bacterium]
MRKFAVFLAGLALLFITAPVRAQAGNPVQLFPPDTRQFPKIRLYLDARDAAGGFIAGLTPAVISLTENGRFVPVDELREIQPGLEIAVAINASPSMAVRNSEGVARYDLITGALADWASSLPTTGGGKFSLFTNGGKPVAQIDDPLKWLEALKAYKADLRNSTPSLESISAALSAIEAAPPQPGIHPAILWITSPPEGTLLASLAGMKDPLQKSGARLIIWSVSPAAAFNSEGSSALRELAESSGGQFFAFSGAEAFPDLNAMLQPLNGIYQLTYTSSASQAGDQSLAVQIQQPDGVLASQPIQFQLDIQAPNPMLVSAPSEILRTCPADSRDPLKALEPLTLSLRALVEFPDGHPRPLQATRLYVDGALVSENTAAPFETFQWNLSGYTDTGRHLLKVEAEDDLGLSKQSLEIPVDIRVVIPPADLKTLVTRHQALATWAAILLAGALLGSAILLGVRKGVFRRREKVAGNQGDPLIQPMPTNPPGHPHGRQVLADRARRLWRGAAHMEPAQLLWLDEEGETLSTSPITLEGHELTFGRNPRQVSYVLNDSSVEPVHCRLTRSETGDFLLHDLGSVAGTWVNYAPISSGGVHLEHGDIIHIGRLTFRFSLMKPGAAASIQVESTSETL